MSKVRQQGFWQTICAANEAWSREACRQRAVAARQGVRLDEQALIFSDVHDLQALQWRLAHGKPVSAHP